MISAVIRRQRPRLFACHLSLLASNADGSLNPNQLLAAFLAFWRQHGQPLLQSAPYHEVAPQLVMMAFLHRLPSMAMAGLNANMPSARAGSIFASTTC